MGLLMVTYPITRFLIEYLRNDEADFFGGLTISQNISIVLFLCGLAYWLWLYRLPRTRYADQADAQDLATTALEARTLTHGTV
jgi:phosphatidylglycerol:prolipoprotein diacylglycerol transferase